jgi:hypothetical protein
MTVEERRPTAAAIDAAPSRAARPHRASAWRPRPLPMAGGVVCALAAWVSFGRMAVAADASSPRVAVLPGWWLPAVAGIALLGLAGWKRIPGRSWWPALIPSVLLLPWLPFPVPAVFLLWTGPVVWLVWAGTAVAVTATALAGRTGDLPRAIPSSVVAFVLSLAVYGGAAWTSAPARPAGDEPHYLIITQSLLLDGDLQIENNHAREDYAAYYNADLRPDYLRRGRNGQIYSVHASGLPALMAPAFAIGGYPAVVVFLVLVSAIGAWLAWRTSFALTRSEGAAWFGWAAVSLSVPFLCHSGAAFPDGPGAVLVMTGVAALVRLERAGATADLRVASSGGPIREGAGNALAWLLQGAALAALPWLHTRFAAAAAVLGASIALRLFARRQLGRLAAFAAVPVASAAAWFGFFYAVYGDFSPAAPYGAYSQSSLANLWPGLPALLLDQQYGLLPNAPVYAVALAGLALLAREHRRLALELALLFVVYLSAAASYSMWWGGWSAPARFAVPVLLALGPCAAWFWVRGHGPARTGAVVVLTLSVFEGAVLTTAAGGRLMFNSRDGVARWLEWLCPVVDLPRGLPSFFHGGPWQAIGDVAIWAALVTAAWFGLRLAVRLPSRPVGGAGLQACPEPAGLKACSTARDRLAAAAPLLTAVTIMTALASVWTVHGELAVTPTSGQLWLLDGFDPAVQPVGVQYRPFRVSSSTELVGRLRVSTAERRPQPANAPSLWVRDVPAGTYRLLRSLAPARPQDVEVRLFKSPLPLQHCAFDATPEDCLIELPVDLVEIKMTVAGGAAPPGPVSRTFALQPVEPLPAAARPTRLKATAGASYGPFSAFALDERIFLEPAGLWVEGGAEVPLVLASRDRRGSVPVLFRNGPRPNTLHVRGGALTLDVALAPREEKVVAVPLDARSRAGLLRIRAEQGFRPSETNPGSRDRRFLGVWLEMAGER